MANQTFFDLPPLKTILTGIGLMAVFLVLACYLYRWNGGSNSQYWLKVADAFINGAIVGLFFALVRLIFDLPKLRAGLRKWRSSSTQ
jgi:RsiW-degrading membrane proteinase PrsW (M82 family)